MQSMEKGDQVIQSLTSLSALLPGRYFRVPDYQRGYAWEASQVSALLEDLEVLARTATSGLHYTGTVVLVAGPDYTPDYPVFDIVDGQQRLTTLNMLLNALIARYERAKGLSAGESDYYQLYIGRGSVLKDYRPVLMLNKDIETFFRALLDGKESKLLIKFLSQKRLAQAYNLITKWTDKQLVEEDESPAVTADKARDWIEMVTTRLGMIAYQPKNANEAGMMFEVINNRGKPLTELEKVKNYLIYYAIKRGLDRMRERIDQEWGTILQNLALAHHMRDIDKQQLLRSAVIVHFGFRKQESNAAYNKLKQEFSLDRGGESDAQTLDSFVEFLSDCSRYYEVLFNKNSEQRKIFCDTQPKLINVIELIREQTAHSGVLPLYLCSMWLFDKKHMTTAELLELLKAIERVNFRVYMLPVGSARADSGHGRLFEIAHTLYRSMVSTVSSDDSRAAITRCHESLYLFVKSYGHKTLDAFKASFKLGVNEANMDFAAWGGLRYFLANYEQTLDPTRTSIIDLQLKPNKADRHNDYVQIEHIYARQCAFCGPDSTQTSYQKRRLGNLMLLEWGVNASFSNKPIEEKFKHLEKNEISAKRTTLAQTTEVITDFKRVFGASPGMVNPNIQDEERFDKYVQLLDRIENRLIEFAGKRWAFDVEENLHGVVSD